MVKKTNKKYLHASVSTALLAATTAVVPVAFASENQYSDLKPSDYFFDSVNRLTERGIFKGFPDGTFQPNQTITRGQTAVILSNLFKLNNANIVDPQFTDVPTSHPYYSAIAAMQNGGYINGYADGSFKPSEPISRYQMAAILVKIFNLQTKNTNTNILPFTDVIDSYKHPVQVLYENGITSGKTSTTFGGTSHVTRGQMATFLTKAEDISGFFVIEEVSSTTIETNKGSLKISKSLKDLFNVENNEALKGASIKVNFENGVVTAIDSLTLNNSGTESKPVALKGGNGSIQTLIVNGDYIEVKDITVYQDVTLSKSVANSFTMTNSTVEGEIIVQKGNETVAAVDNNYAINPQNLTLQLNGTTVLGILAQRDNLTLHSDTKISFITLDMDINKIVVNGEVGKIEVNVNVNLELTGNATIDELLITQANDVAVNLAGTVKQLIVTQTNLKVEISSNTKIDVVELPNNVTPESIISNYDAIKKSISKVVDEEGNVVDTPSSGSGGSSGGGSRDNENEVPNEDNDDETEVPGGGGNEEPGENDTTPPTIQNIQIKDVNSTTFDSATMTLTVEKHTSISEILISLNEEVELVTGDTVLIKKPGSKDYIEFGTIALGSDRKTLVITTTGDSTEVVGESLIKLADGVRIEDLEGNELVGEFKLVVRLSNIVEAYKAKGAFQSAYESGNLDWDTLITAVYYLQEARKAGEDVSALEQYYSEIDILDMSGKTESNYDISTRAFVEFKGLKSLNLEGTGISELGGLLGLTKLEKLDVSNNNLEDNDQNGVVLGALVNSTSLQLLDISDNQGIKNISPLVELSTTSDLATINMLDIGILDKDKNPINPEVSQWIQMLKNTNIKVFWNSEFVMKKATEDVEFSFNSLNEPILLGLNEGGNKQNISNIISIYKLSEDYEEEKVSLNTIEEENMKFFVNNDVYVEVTASENFTLKPNYTNEAIEITPISNTLENEFIEFQLFVQSVPIDAVEIPAVYVE